MFYVKMFIEGQRIKVEYYYNTDLRTEKYFDNMNTASFALLESIDDWIR